MAEIFEYTQRLTAVEVAIAQLNHRLYGNGQPGDVKLIIDKLDTLRALYWKSLGFVAALAFVVPLVFEIVKLARG